MRQTRASREKGRKGNIAANLLQQHLVRPRTIRPANDNKGPALHVIKGMLFWSALIALTGFMLHAQFTS